MKPNHEGMRRMMEAKDDNWCWDRETKGEDAAIYGPTMNMVLFNWFNWFCGTTAVLGTRRLNGGHYYWEMQTGPDLHLTSTWNVNPFPNELNDYMMFGIGTRNARVSSIDTKHLIGETDQSWGLDNLGQVWHKGQKRPYVPPFGGPSVIGIYFNGIQGTLSFSVDGYCPQIAFEGLNDVKEDLFPMIGSTIYKSELFMIRQKKDYTSLLDMCRSVITKRIVHPNQCRMLELPLELEDYVNEELELPQGMKRGIHDMNGLESAKWAIDMHSSWYVETAADRSRKIILWLLNIITKVINEADRMRDWYFIEKNISQDLAILFDYYWITKCNTTIVARKKKILSWIKPFEDQRKVKHLQWFPGGQNKLLFNIPKSIPPYIVIRDSEDAPLLKAVLKGPQRNCVEPPVFGSGQAERDLCILRGIQSSLKIIRNYYVRSSMAINLQLQEDYIHSNKSFTSKSKIGNAQHNQDWVLIRSMLWKMIIFPHVKQVPGITYIRTCCYLCEILSRGQ